MLHLHAGPPLENEGGPRAHVRVPRDGGLRACFLSGGAGEDFGRGGPGEQFGWREMVFEVGAVGHVQPVRTRVPRRRAVRARVGVLEDVCGAVGEGPGFGSLR